MLVVSEETKGAAGEINDTRARRGLPPLSVCVVPLVMAQDGILISSRRISQGLIDRNGRRLQPLRIAIGSSNPSKLRGAKKALQKTFPRLRLVVRGFDVDSGVHEQPLGFGITWMGALNRAKAAAKRWPKADYSIGLESGLLPLGERHFDVQLCALLAGAERRPTCGMSMGFSLPKKVEKMVVGPKGEIRSSLGDAIDSLSGQRHIGRKKGALFYLSQGLLERSEMTEQAVLCAWVERRSPV